MKTRGRAAATSRRKKDAEDRELRARVIDHESESISNPGTEGGSPLPKGWRWVTLGEVAESMKNGIYRPASSYADDGLACLRMYNIDEGRIVWRDVKRMRLSEQEIREYELLPGDLLVNRVNSRELVGKTAAIPSTLERCVFESKNIRVRLRRDLVSPEFVSYRLLSAGSRYFTQNAQQVVGMASISQPQVARFPIPLPPLPEQRRIVEEIEKQFTRLDAAILALRRVQTNLKRYRNAILMAACDGSLVTAEATVLKSADWGPIVESGVALLSRILSQRRQDWQGTGKFKEPATADIASLPALPDGWAWATLEQLCPLFVDSPHRTPIYGDAGLPAIGPRDVVGGQLNLSRTRLVNAAEFSAQTTRHIPQPGDIVYSRELSLGWAAVVPPEEQLCLSQGMCLFRPHGALSRSYFLSVLNGPVGRRQAEMKAVGSAHPHLNLGDIKAYAFPLPPRLEQERIAAEVERRVSGIDELEAVMHVNLERAARLRQSLLSKAFAGDLVAREAAARQSTVTEDRRT